MGLCASTALQALHGTLGLNSSTGSTWGFGPLQLYRLYMGPGPLQAPHGGALPLQDLGENLGPVGLYSCTSMKPSTPLMFFERLRSHTKIQMNIHTFLDDRPTQSEDDQMCKDERADPRLPEYQNTSLWCLWCPAPASLLGKSGEQTG